MQVFETLESEVRSYCRGWPAVFDRAVGSHLYDEKGREFLDFFAGAGALNYGHNHPKLKRSLLDYLEADRVVHSLDMYSSAKRDFLQTFHEVILEPRRLPYKVQFPGPTGTNAVESALKLARKVTGKQSVIGFTNAFHGMTLGSLAVTGNSMKRDGAGVPLAHATSMPYDDYLDGRTPDFFLLERLLSDSGSGLDSPAAVIVETVQGEGGVNVASPRWLHGLAELCKREGILLIVDDVQMGCGRTGPFFSFEIADIQPDIVCLSKSIGGYGLPLALTLFRSDLDIWEPGEHNGTFRGQNPSFVTGTAALEEFWRDDTLQQATAEKARQMAAGLETVAERHAEQGATYRGRGLIWGLSFGEPDLADQVCSAAFERGLLIETSGPNSEVIKFMPPLTVTEGEIEQALDILADSVKAATAAHAAA